MNDITENPKYESEIISKNISKNNLQVIKRERYAIYKIRKVIERMPIGAIKIFNDEKVAMQFYRAAHKLNRKPTRSQISKKRFKIQLLN